jgi:hypothetical protein
MKQNVNFSRFVESFGEAGRGKQFSYQGLDALYDYLTVLEEDLGEELELDVIALCCDYGEYGSIEEALADYGFESINELEDRTTVIPIPDSDGVIVEVF